MNLLVIFIGLSIVNVIFSTVKSIVTIKSGPLVASIVSATYYAFYSVVLVYTVADFPLWQKVVVTGVCNLVGVFVVKYAEKKTEKSRLWKIEVTIPTEYKTSVDLELQSVPHSYIELSDKHTLFNFYCATQKESQRVKDIVNHYDAKYFVAESKTL